MEVRSRHLPAEALLFAFANCGRIHLKREGRPMMAGLRCYWYAGHDTGSGVEISKRPVRRNSRVEDKFATARLRMKEV